MFFLPLPFVVAIMLAILLVQRTDRGGDNPSNRLFLSLIGIYAVLSVLIGLRWGYGVKALLPLQSVLAAAWASLAWLSFRNLARGGVDIQLTRDWLHAIPALGVLLLVLLWPLPIDLVLVAIYLIYGLALARLAWPGPDALGTVRLEEAPPTYRALQITAAVLIAFALIDVLISIDIRVLDGRHSGMIVGIANVPALLLLGVAAAIAGRGQPTGKIAVSGATESAASDAECESVLRQIDDLMQTKGVFRDCDLNLERLARKSGITARRISMAINRIEGKNVSQYVNDFRIAEACRLLRATDLPVTALMFEAGFLTKSNFNREFRRVTGINPQAWRAKFPNVAERP